MRIGPEHFGRPRIPEHERVDPIRLFDASLTNFLIDWQDPTLQETHRQQVHQAGMALGASALSQLRVSPEYSKVERFGFAEIMVRYVDWRNLPETPEREQFVMETIHTLACGEYSPRLPEVDLYNNQTRNLFEVAAQVALGEKAEELSPSEQIRYLANSAPFTQRQRWMLALVRASQLRLGGVTIEVRDTMRTFLLEACAYSPQDLIKEAQYVTYRDFQLTMFRDPKVRYPAEFAPFLIMQHADQFPELRQTDPNTFPEDLPADEGIMHGIRESSYIKPETSHVNSQEEKGKE